MRILSRFFKKQKTPAVAPNFEEIAKDIDIDVNRIVELKLIAEFFKKHKERYVAVSVLCNNFPADLLCALHYRESSLRWDACLHNGERILGTGKKTRLVPAGRGPFKTWEEAAVDAIMMKRSLFPAEWTLANKLAFAEKYNGLGYRKTGELSPYVFAGTNKHDETGKYVADGKYSSTAPEKQLGVAAILLSLV